MSKWLEAWTNFRSWALGSIILLMVIGTVTGVLLMAEQPQDKPDYNVKVKSFWPEEYLNLNEPANIMVKFSRDLMPSDSLDKLTADIPLDIKPPISGLGKWIAPDKFAYYPDSAFRPSTEYTVKVKSDRTYLYGNRINEPREFKLRTPTIIVQGVWHEVINVPPSMSRLLIHIRFNYPVDPVQLLEHFNSDFRSSHQEIRLAIQDNSPNTELVLLSEPYQAREVDGEFHLSITRGLGCVGGQVPLQADYPYKFYLHAPPAFVVEQTYPSAPGENSRIIVQMSSSAALDDAKEAISIDPPIKFIVHQVYSQIELIGNFKPRETYTVNIKKGFRALSGQILERDFSTKISFGDMRPSIAFKDEGLYMSRKSNRLLAVESVNINTISVEVEHVFVNNIIYYLSDYGRYYYSSDISRVGRRIFSKDYKLASSSNVPLISTIDIGKIVGDSLEGIYNVSVRVKDERWRYVTKRILITDLGILARMSDNYLMVWVNSLAGTGPVSDVEISLISRNNQVLISGKTDSRGVIIFDNIAEKTAGYEPFVITAAKGNDLSYLQFNESLVATTDFDISGRPFLTRGFEPFIYTDRGVYRPGETAHLVCVMRGVNGSVPSEFPYKLLIDDPQGHDFSEYKLTTKDRGLSSLDIDIPSFAKTGNYQVSAKIGEDVIGQYSFQVEEFMPDRIKTILTTDKDIYNAGEEAKIAVNGVYLFGPPCAGNEVKGHVTIEADVFSPKNWSGYIFADPATDFSAIQADLPSDKLDDAGNYTYTYTISPNLRPPSSLKMLISATVLEEGGRGVSAYKTVAAYPYQIYLGLKHGAEGYAKVGQPFTINAIAVDGKGKAVGLDSGWIKFYEIVYQNIVKQDAYGIYRYVSEESEQILDSSLVSLSDSGITVSFTPHDYGSYRVRFTSSLTQHKTAMNFYASGWGYAPWSMAKPERLEIELDRKSYRAGQTARLLVKAPFSGKLLLTVEKEKVLELKTYDIDSNTAQIELQVKKDYAPNVYVTGTLIKSTTSLERYSPARAFGLVRLPVDNSDMKIKIDIDAPTVVKPRQKIDFRIKTNLKKGTRLTLAAVDMGIIQLTDFKMPDPFEFFHGKKRPALKPYDIYSRVFPDIKIAESNLSPGGSAAFDAARKRHLNPLSVRRVKPVALWSGFVQTDSSGQALVSFDLPQFNGKLIIMVVGFNEEKCGSATGEVTVRDKIVIQESLPRFIAPGDKIISPIVVFNNIGQPDSFDVAMKIAGPASLVSTNPVRLFIPDNGKAVARFTFTAGNKPGKVTFDITATNGAEKSKETVELANRPAQPLLTLSGSGTVTADSSVKITIPAQWLEGTGEYELKISSLPSIRLACSIEYLLVYPYGCLEQTTSHVFPLLYFNDLARIVKPEIFGTKGQEYFIAEGIQKISGMQLPSGAFSFWQGEGQASKWSSIYATHFLVEARKAGYQISDKVYDKALDYMQNVVKDESAENDRGTARIYAAYVLAKTGKLDRSIINNLKKLNMIEIPVYSRFQLAAAIALVSGLDEAIALMPIEIQPLKYEPETGGNFDSDIRANAILLDVLSEIQPNHPSIPILLKNVSEALYFDEWYTTQSNAFALMAIGKFLKTQGIPDYTGTIEVNGKIYKQFTTKDFRVLDETLGGKEITISIKGKGNSYYYWQSSGVSTDKAANEFDKRMEVRRKYLKVNGQPLDLTNVKLGDQVVAEISIVSTNKDLANVVINDLLPSCFEIENPRLTTSGRLSWVPENDFEVSYMDIRDDRILLFTNLSVQDRNVYHYLIRVVSAGDFTVPSVASECMYDPTVASASSSNRVVVFDGQ